MTAEIAILNNQAVAMAADSAVTFQKGGAQKIFPSANKIFALSHHAPVGIMVYSSAQFMQIPWETVIKRFRTQLGRETFASLQEYADRFLEHIRTSPALLSDNSEQAYVRAQVFGFFRKIRRDFEERVEQEIADHGEAQVTPLFAEVVDSHYQIWRQTRNLPLVPRGAPTQVRARADGIIGEAIVDTFEQVPLTGEIDRKLKQIGRWLFVRMPEQYYTSDHSGVVVAGFGDDDLMPRLRSYTIEGRLGAVLHCREGHSVSIGDDGSRASIVPFAQTDVVDTFMQGVNPEYQTALEADFAKILSSIPSLILGQVPELADIDREQILSDCLDISRQVLQEYRSWLRQTRHERYVEPVLDVVRFLPKDELAEMVEALVSLTSFKRRMSLDQETVGGPVDVAIISKGDGLVWIKRKQYFPAELNQQFLANYLRASDG